MPVTLPSAQPSIPNPLLNESLEPYHDIQGQWTTARKVTVCFLAFVGVCILLQMIRAGHGSTRVDNRAEKAHDGKKKKIKAPRAPSTRVEVSVTNDGVRYSNAPGTPVIKCSSEQKQEELWLPSFNAIEIRIPANVTIEKGTQRVTLAADGNIFNVLVAKVEEARLILEAKPNTAFETRKPINYTIVIPSLQELKVTTAAKVSISNLQGDSFKCWIEGNSLVEAKGQVKHQEVNIWDAATYNGRYLTSDKTTLQVYGAGKVHVKVVHKLIGIIQDNGECTYYGEPTNPKIMRISDKGKINCHVDVRGEV